MYSHLPQTTKARCALDPGARNRNPRGLDRSPRNLNTETLRGQRKQLQLLEAA